MKCTRSAKPGNAIRKCLPQLQHGAHGLVAHALRVEQARVAAHAQHLPAGERRGLFAQDDDGGTFGHARRLPGGAWASRAGWRPAPRCRKLARWTPTRTPIPQLDPAQLARRRQLRAIGLMLIAVADVRADGFGAEDAVGALPALPGGRDPRARIASARARVGVGDGRAAAAVPRALVAASAARRARHRDDGGVRLRAEVVAACRRRIRSSSSRPC